MRTQWDEMCSPSNRRGKLFSADFFFYDHSCNMANGYLTPLPMINVWPCFPSSLAVNQRPFSLPLGASTRKLTRNLNRKSKHSTSLLFPNYGGDGDSLGGLDCPLSRQVPYSSWHLPKVGQSSLALVREHDFAGSCLSTPPPLMSTDSQGKKSLNKT